MRTRSRSRVAASARAIAQRLTRIAMTDRTDPILRKRFILRPPVAVLWALGPVVFEGSLSGALVDAAVRRLISFMGDHAFGVLQMQHATLGSGFFRCDDIFQELAQLGGIGHVAAED